MKTVYDIFCESCGEEYQIATVADKLDISYCTVCGADIDFEDMLDEDEELRMDTDELCDIIESSVENDEFDLDEFE